MINAIFKNQISIFIINMLKYQDDKNYIKLW